MNRITPLCSGKIGYPVNEGFSITGVAGPGVGAGAVVGALVAVATVVVDATVTMVVVVLADGVLEVVVVLPDVDGLGIPVAVRTDRGPRMAPPANGVVCTLT